MSDRVNSEIGGTEVPDWGNRSVSWGFKVRARGERVKFSEKCLTTDMEMVVIPVTTFARVIRSRPWVRNQEAM